MNNLLQQLKTQFNSGSMSLKLIIINASIFVVYTVLSLIIKLFVREFDLLRYFSVPMNIGDLLYKPWTIVTHLFFHVGLGHLFWNMVMLYFLGNYFQSRLGNKKLLSVYLVGGFTGFLFAWLCYSIFPVLINQIEGISLTLVGASAGISAIMVAIGFYTPNQEIRVPFIQRSFKLLHVILFFVILDVIRLNADIGDVRGNSGGWLAHIGGAIFGYFYATFLLKGKNILKGFEKFLDSFFNIVKGNFKLKKKTKLKVNKGGGSKKPPKDDYDYNTQRKDNQNRTDVILDKISKSGYESLTKKEKDFLFTQSKK